MTVCISTLPCLGRIANLEDAGMGRFLGDVAME